MGGSIKTRFTYIKLLLFLIILIDKIVEIGNIIEQLNSYFGQYILVGTIFHISRNDNSHHLTGFPRSHHICFKTILLNPKHAYNRYFLKRLALLKLVVNCTLSLNNATKNNDAFTTLNVFWPSSVWQHLLYSLNHCGLTPFMMHFEPLWPNTICDTI